MEFAPLQKTRLFEEIVKQFEKQVKEGMLKPGEQLPSERELSEQMQVSRTTVREALRTLEIMGYVSIKPGEGVFVKEFTIEEALQKLTTSVKVDTYLIYDSLEVRDLVEEVIARKAAQNRTEQDLLDMKAAIEDMEAEIASGGVGLRGDEQFHLAISHATQNHVYELIMHVLADFLSKSRRMTLEVECQREITLADHKSIYNAIEAGDSEEAARCMKRHIANAKKFMLEIIEKNEQ